MTDEHLARLSEIAAADHELFCRKHPEYADRRVAVTLAQGAASHYLDGKNGVKDLDTYTFYARLPGTHPGVFGSRINVHRDFGPSEHGRQLYDLSAAKDERQRRRWAKWSAEHRGRRVDLYIRPLDVAPDAGAEAVVRAIREWLRAGQRSRKPLDKRPTPWWLAQKAVIVIDPAGNRGMTVWPDS